MQKKISRLYRLAAIVCAFVMLAGCSATVADPVVGKVENKELLFSRFYSAFSTNYQYYQFGMHKFDETQDPIEELKKLAFDSIINDAVVDVMVEKKGITLDADALAEVETETAEAIESALEDFAEQVDPSITDEAAIREAKMKLLVEALKNNGYTYDSYCEKAKSQIADEKLRRKLLTEVQNEATVSDEEVKSWYDENLELQKTQYAEDPAAFYQAYSMSMNYNSGVRPIVAPEGYFYVKHILIQNPDEENEEDADKDVNAIADEVLAKLAAGEDFDALLEEYNEDPGMTADSEGYLMNEKLTDQYVPEFYNGALALKENEISGKVESSYGIHIIKRLGAVDTTPIPFEDLKEEIHTQLLREAKVTHEEETIAAWRESMKVVTYPKRVENIAG